MLEFFGIHVLKKLTGKDEKYIRIVIDKYNALSQTKNIFLIYDYIFFGFSSISASSVIPNTVVISFGWLRKLIENNDLSTENAFLIMLGHELTHKKGDFSQKLCFRRADRKFVNWVNEVHADFGAAKEMAGGSRKALVESVKYKLLLKPYSTDTHSHPSWARRLEYATNYNFDETLIQKIAADAAASASLLQPVIAFFQPIVLS